MLSRVVYQGKTTTAAVKINSVKADVVFGAAPLRVAFTSSVTGFGVTYSWNFGDNTVPSNQANPVHVFPDGAYDVYLVATDRNGNTALSNSLRIVAGTPPQPVILSPAPGHKVRAGELVTLQAGINSTRGYTVNDFSFSWTVIFVHDDHTHPALDGVEGVSTTLVVPDKGHSFSTTTYYQVTLTATDAMGISGQVVGNFQPDLVAITLQVNPSSVLAGKLSFTLDSDTTELAPFTTQSIKGFNHLVSMPAEACINLQLYKFANWSDGVFNASRKVTVGLSAADNNIFLANYNRAGSCAPPCADQGFKCNRDADCCSGNCSKKKCAASTTTSTTKTTTTTTPRCVAKSGTCKLHGDCCSQNCNKRKNTCY